MTNEQLAVFLMALAGRVHALAREIEPSIRAGDYQTKTVWAGEGKEPALTAEDILRWKTSTVFDPSNWREEIVRPAACAMVEALGDELSEMADNLWAPAPNGTAGTP